MTKSKVLVSGFIGAVFIAVVFQNCGKFVPSKSTESSSSESQLPFASEDSLGEILTDPSASVAPFKFPVLVDDTTIMAPATFLENCSAMNAALDLENFFAYNRSKIKSYGNVNYFFREEVDHRGNIGRSAWTNYSAFNNLVVNSPQYIAGGKTALTTGNMTTVIDSPEVFAEAIKDESVLPNKVGPGLRFHQKKYNISVTPKELIQDSVITIEKFQASPGQDSYVKVKIEGESFFPAGVKSNSSSLTYNFDPTCRQLLSGWADSRILSSGAPFSATVLVSSLKIVGDELIGQTLSHQTVGGPAITPYYSRQTFNLKNWEFAFETAELISDPQGELLGAGESFRILKPGPKTVLSFNTRTQCYDYLPHNDIVAAHLTGMAPMLLEGVDGAGWDTQTCKRIRAGENLTYTPTRTGLQNCEGDYDSLVAALNHYQKNPTPPVRYNTAFCPKQFP